MPQNVKKKAASKKSKGGMPVVLELSLDKETCLYNLDFAGKKCKSIKTK